MELWFVRHGETEDNKKNLIQGWRGGQLSSHGIKQAQVVGKRLGKEHFDTFYSSDLKRTMDTAQAIYDCFPPTDKPPLIVPDYRLREKGGGKLEGMPLGTPSTQAKAAGVSAREFRPDGGESWLDVNARVKSFAKEVAKRHMINSKYAETPVAVEPVVGATDEAKASIAPVIAKASLEEQKVEPAKGPLSVTGSKATTSVKSSTKVKGGAGVAKKAKAPTEPPGPVSKDSGIPDRITYPAGYIPRILCVSHGGLIMEFLNYVDSFSSIPEGTRQNKAKNCAIFIFRFTETEDKLGFRIDSIVENDVEHLNTGGAEDRGRGIGNA